MLRAGRFGPYVTDGTTNASLRQGDDQETITHERAVELLADRRAAGPPAKRAKKAAKSQEGGQDQEGGQGGQEGAGQEGTAAGKAPARRRATQAAKAKKAEGYGRAAVG